MTIILRMQGLDVKAGTEDIRAFFEDLHVPDGGVYIVGGNLREAFIAFNTESDAQLAMRHTGHCLKGSKVTLYISSIAELEHKLQSLLKKKETSQLTVRKPQLHSTTDRTLTMQPHDDTTANLSSSAAWPLDPDSANLPPSYAQHVCPYSIDAPGSNAQALDSSTAFLLGVCTVLQGLQSSYTAVPKGDSPNDDGPPVLPVDLESEQALDSKPGYVSLFGLPASTTKEDICQFFKGLTVQEAIVNAKLGHSHGCLVKFSKMHEASDALRFNHQLLGSKCVEVRGADDRMWTSALQERENASDVSQKLEKHSIKLSVNKKSSTTLQLKRKAADQSPFKPSKMIKSDTDSNKLSESKGYVVMVTNLPKNITKTELKELFGCPNIAHKDVLHLLDIYGNTTDTSFFIFSHAEDFEYAMHLSGCHVGSGTIEVSSTTKEKMREMMAKTHPRNQNSRPKDPRKQSQKVQPELIETELPSKMTQDQSAKMCLFVRNMPAFVQKSQLMSLFGKYKVKMNDIILLRDIDGNGIGEAVVKFESENLAAQAWRIHGKDFLGKKVLITGMNVKQMEDIVANM
ncbi:RNA binding motif protein 12Ba [Melanotaenia boesemani]|uniref:RNA binding motif protein 12Ba n=1 Tax=Melanotaenia boesemani TaxID=1250792 RepID=UPI001C0423F0|nr:RNA binding motif protein 12Ba [Melanotaenia boesemani]XP_041844917.1 RNA binding motif protein 12Ba [Melanotaenia boesemani]